MLAQSQAPMGRPLGALYFSYIFLIFSHSYSLRPWLRSYSFHSEKIRKYNILILISIFPLIYSLPSSLPIPSQRVWLSPREWEEGRERNILIKEILIRIQKDKEYILYFLLLFFSFATFIYIFHAKERELRRIIIIQNKYKDIKVYNLVGPKGAGLSPLDFSFIYEFSSLTLRFLNKIS